MLKQLAARKSVAAIAREIETGPRLKRVLSARTLTSIGLGSMIGSGISKAGKNKPQVTQI